MSDLHKGIAKIIATAWADGTNKFQNDLIACKNREEIKKFLKAHGLELPDFPDFPKDGEIKFVANTEKLRYLVIPERPKFTDEDMALVVKLRQNCAMDCSCTLFCGGSAKPILETIIHKIFGGE